MQRRAKDAEQAVSEVIAGQLRLRSSDIIFIVFAAENSVALQGGRE